jgi:AP-1 complex subunit beta-1
MKLTALQVQLQILTAVVKLFLKKPDQSQGLVQKVLQAATAENDNPDIRDRAYVYWRLLSSDPQIAKVSTRVMVREICC